MNDTHPVADEKYEFKSGTRAKLFMLFGAGLLLFIIGVLMPSSAEHAPKTEGKEHTATEISKNMVCIVHSCDRLSIISASAKPSRIWQSSTGLQDLPVNHANPSNPRHV